MQAWRKAALRLHPDKNQGDPNAQERFTQAKEAYEVSFAHVLARFL
jgi:molecular chaperone DnaJ